MLEECKENRKKQKMSHLKKKKIENGRIFMANSFLLSSAFV